MRVYSSDVGRRVKEEAARDRVAFSRAAHIGSNEPPPGYASAMVASLQCPLPFHLVSWFRRSPLADHFFAGRRTRVGELPFRGASGVGSGGTRTHLSP